MSQLEPRNTSVNIYDLLKYNIDMPIFQRGYSWGVGEKSEKPRQYFVDFLTSENHHHDFGNIFIYSHFYYKESSWSNPGEIGSDGLINLIPNVFLADGQHRVVTFVLSLYAALFFLKSDYLNNKINKKKTSIDNDEKLEGAELEISKNNILEDKIIKQIENIKFKITADDELTIVDIKEIVKKENINSYKYTSAFKSFIKLNEYLIDNKSSIKNKINLVNILLKRAKEFTAGIKILENDQTKKRSIPDIENQAYSIFMAMNGQSTQLNDEELFVSFLKQPTLKEHTEDKVLFLFKNPKLINSEFSKIKDIFKYFKLNSHSDKFDYFFKSNMANHLELNMDREYLLSDSYLWIRNIIGSSDHSKQLLIIDELSKNINILKTFYDSCKDIENDVWETSDPTRYVLDIYTSNMKKSVTSIVYAVKTYEEIINNFSQKTEFAKNLSKLIKVMFMLNLMKTYNGRESRPNTSRDVLDLNYNIESGFSFFADHFIEINDKTKTKADLFIELEISFKKHLVTCNFTKFINEAKVVLMLAEIPNNNSSFKNIIDKHYDLEHILAKKFNPLDEDSLKDLEIKNPMLYLCQKEYKNVCIDKKHLVHSIGNMALLNKTPNRRNKNISPYDKIELKQKGWLSTHFDSLDKSKGIWGANKIESRASEIANACISWLFKDFSADDLTNKFERKKKS